MVVQFEQNKSCSTFASRIDKRDRPELSLQNIELTLAINHTVFWTTVNSSSLNYYTSISCPNFRGCYS